MEAIDDRGRTPCGTRAVREAGHHDRHKRRLVGLEPLADRALELRLERRLVPAGCLGELDLDLLGELREDGAIRSRTAASSRPGGTRVSITAWATDGITLSRAEALALVGTRVTRSIGSAR